MLTSLPGPALVLWMATTFLTSALLIFILSKRQSQRFPFLTLYLIVNLLETVLQVFVIQKYGDKSHTTYAVMWASQAPVVLARALATGEFCRLVLARYRGVWALAWRILVLSSMSILVLAVYFGKDGFRYAVMTLEIGAESFIATLVVGTFLFARYYEIEMERSVMLLGLGLGLNSCVKILNDVVLSRYFAAYVPVWNDVAMAAFVAVLLLWIGAIRATASVRLPAPELSSAEAYEALIPGVNERLRQLNDELVQLWRMEQPKT